MRRKQGILLPIELNILDVCESRSLSGSPECHGFLIASLIKGTQNAKLLTAYGTLYRALSRLEKAGFLTSRWEDISSLAGESRPRRRLYRITDAGSKALAESLTMTIETATAIRVIQLPEREIA
jgi:DNA-binding PadR family transcriptional regulator